MSIFRINETSQEWDILGFVDDNHSHYGKECCGVKVLGGREILDKYRDAFILAVPGSPHNYLARKDILDNLGIDNSRYATIIHPSVERAPDACIGYNTLIMPHVVVSCSVTIGNHCIFLPNTVIAHDSNVSDYCCVGSNVSISGAVTIGPGCYIGSGVKVRENIRIGSRSLIGLGANVVSDIEDNTVAFGNPAKVIRKNSS